MQLIDGKKTATAIKQEIAEEVLKIKKRGEKTPHLAAVLVGEDPASQTYVRAKEKACRTVGFQSTIIRLNKDVKEINLLKEIEKLNQHPQIDGFIVQLPLPSHISESKIIQAIDPRKDVDGFHPVNVGRMVAGLTAYLPATPAGIVELLKRYHIETSGKHCVVLGRSNIVGTPVSILLSRKKEFANCTVTLCHSRTKNIENFIKNADIIIAALGLKHFVKAEMVKEGAVIVDVGIHRIKSDRTRSGYQLVGDVDFQQVASKCSFITPVPGGVGPMTIVSLLKNTLFAAQKAIYFS